MSFETSCPLLREDVVVTPFESHEGRERFVVAIDSHHYLVDRSTAALIDGLRAPTSFDALAARVGATLGVELDEEDVRSIVNDRLPKALFQPTDDAPKSPLSWQRTFINARVLAPIIKVTSRLVNQPIAWLFLLLLGAVDTAVLLRYLQEPIALSASTIGQWLVAVLLTLLGTLIHELGHVSALGRFGIRSGGIGFGIYWFFPVFFADVSATWRLPSAQRAVVDAGGLYFQGIYIVCVGAWALVAAEPLVPMLVMWTSHFMMLYTLNPTLKFDGYWLLSDLTGCVNLHGRIANTARWTLARLCGRQPEESPKKRELWVLVAFCLSTLAYFLYVFTSLIRSLVGTVGWLTTAQDKAWLHVLPMTLLAGLLCMLLLLIAARCARSLVNLTNSPEDIRRS